MNSFILLLILWSLIECFFKKISVYEEFIKGVKEGLQLLKVIFPVLLLLTLWINLLQSCGIMILIEKMFVHLHQFLRVPLDLFIMCFIRPISSQGAMVILKSIYDQFGADHSFSILASVIQTGSDTTLYVVSLYFQAMKAKRSYFPLILGLCLDFLACLLAFIGYYLFII